MNIKRTAGSATSQQQLMKLPNLSDVMNVKLKGVKEEELQQFIQELVKQIQSLNTQVTQKDKTIQQYEFMIRSLQIALDKRDCIISAMRQEKQGEAQITKVISQDSARLPTSKRILRARTKETNYDKTLQTLLDSELSSLEQYVNLYRELQHISLLQQMIQNEEQFMQNIQKMDYGQLVSILDAIQLIASEHKMMFKNTLRMQQLQIELLQLNDETISLNEHLDRFQEMMKEGLDCDRVQIYILDNEHQELWTRVKDQLKKMTIHEDLPGICFQEKTTINIHNAYNDPRFKKENDKGTKTNNLLFTPIMDKQQNPIGVIQAINKHGAQFNNEDIQYMIKLANVIAIMLRTQQELSESMSIQNSLRNLLTILFTNMYNDSIGDILCTSELFLKNIFKTQKAFIYLVADNRYHKVNEHKNLDEFPSGIGIVGQAHLNKEFLWVKNAYNHQLFNSLGIALIQKIVDIETTMPIYCLYVQGKTYSLIIQVVNNKGIRAQKVSSFDQELLEMFGKIVLSRVDYIKL